ncbi:hypothetical protein ACFVZR_06345 [Streptomyces sp. NPDC058316]|uniref:hypothetical protein n=1 Tax=Streptomyces sp. NPDC058316 TaxID=3346442 RepID=UPI0036EDAE06
MARAVRAASVLPRHFVGELVASGWFVIGHDQRALHARISKIGTVREFIDWFDSTYVEPTDK